MRRNGDVMDWATDLDSELSRLLQVEAFAQYRGWFDALHARNADRLHEISEIQRVESFSGERLQALRRDLGKALLLTLITEPAVLKIVEYRVFNLGRQLDSHEIVREVMDLLELAVSGLDQGLR
jgi:hypothetical protein